MWVKAIWVNMYVGESYMGEQLQWVKYMVGEQ